MTGQTKKQREALELAIHIVEYEPDTLKSREWQNLFKDGYNNTNSILIGLMEAIDSRPRFYKEILEAKQYMPALLVSYATYKAGESEQEAMHEKIINDLDIMFNAIDKAVNYNKPYGVMTAEKWGNLSRYYIEPLGDYIQ